MSTNKNIIPFVDLKAQYAIYKSDIDAAINGVLDHGIFVMGPDVKAFESDFAAFTETTYALGISNGLDALRIALAALDIGHGDEVIVPTNSFIATALAVTGVGATPVFVDCDRHTYEIDATVISQAITPKTKAIIPVHLTGLAADMDAVNAIATKHKLAVVEDAAQSQGARYKGRACGSLGHIGCTSFFPGKNLGAYGDAGAVTTNDLNLAKKMDMLRNYGQEQKYHHIVQGLNCRLDTMQAAILRVKLKHLAAWNEARREHAKAYIERLRGIGDLQFQHIPSDCVPIYHLFIIETERRDALKDFLHNEGVMCTIHYPTPIHLQPAYANLDYKKGSMPNAEYLADRILSLPMFPELSLAQIDRICDLIKQFYSGARQN